MLEMKQIIQNLGTGETSIIEVPCPSLKERSIRINSAASLISAGTEKMLVSFSQSSYLSKARQQPDKVIDVLDKVRTDGLAATYSAVKSKLDEPIPLGYSNVGRVVEVSEGVTDFKLGDRVVSNGAHAEQVVVGQNLCAKIPDNVTDEAAAFTIVGSIALQGLRLAKPTIGERFVVIGAGLIGLITVQLLRANGCQVLAIDVDQAKLKLAANFGAETCMAHDDDNILSAAHSFTGGLGVDGVIITASTPANNIIKNAANISRKRGRIILVGVVGLSLDRSDFYEKELSFQVSCSYGPGRYDENYEQFGIDYPLSFVRWTEKRNFQAFLVLLSNGDIDVEPLISGRFKFSEAVNVYRQLVSGDLGLGTLLMYERESNLSLKKTVPILKGKEYEHENEFHVAVIGAGNFASRVLIPAFKKNDLSLHTIVSEGGLSSAFQGSLRGFAYASTDLEEVLSNDLVNLIVIATRHNTHSDLVSKCLAAGKNVWVEKPLCIDRMGLQKVSETIASVSSRDSTIIRKPQLMVGFNRRFSPHVVKMCELLSTRSSPVNIVMTINAGSIPSSHWTQDLSEGGGRIIGEVCHFVDLARCLVGDKIINARGVSMQNIIERQSVIDDSSFSLSFADGSLCTIIYTASGAKSFPKERIEVFVEGKILQLDNFKKLTGFGWKNFRKLRTFSQDKGQKSAVKAFISGLKTGEVCIATDELIEVAGVTLDLHDLVTQN